MSNDQMNVSRSGGDLQSTNGGSGYESSLNESELFARFSVGGDNGAVDRSMGSFSAVGSDDGGGDNDVGGDEFDDAIPAGQLKLQEEHKRWRCIFCDHGYAYKTATAMIQHLVPGQPERIPCHGEHLKAFLEEKTGEAMAAGASVWQAERAAKAAAAEACRTVVVAPVMSDSDEAEGAPEGDFDCEWCGQRRFKDANSLRQHQGLATNWLLGYEPTACRSLPDGFHEGNKGSFVGTPLNWWVADKKKEA